MINLADFRKDPTPWIESDKKRWWNLDFDLIINLDNLIRENKQLLQTKLAERNEISSKIPVYLKEWKDVEELKEKVKTIKEDIAIYQWKLDQLEEEFDKLVLQIPNILDKDVPVWKDDRDRKSVV